MAHYDCSNCGESGGIDFGYCRSCTPAEFTEAKRELSDISNKAASEWAEKDQERAMRHAEKRRKWIAKREKKLGIKKAKKTLHNIEMEHHHSYRYLHEHEQKKKENR